ncbi:MAG: homoserine dehydrogenase [Bifidobacteriaceae bacterium]|jgi:homoserine dehydrogenase|nr:homoserine dehydrogenase [Bifidobacteriaceae bacterium]
MSHAASRSLRVALLGFGVVGSQVGRLLVNQAAELSARAGIGLKLIGVAVKNRQEPAVAAASSWLPKVTENAAELLEDCDIAVELIGGVEPARSLIRQAIDAGASVVTANKALLAVDGPALYQAAADAGVDLYYEAAVAGAIPIVRGVRESLAGDNVQRILGIVNGTTNYVLDQMTRHDLPYDQALTRAQRLGYAEADPTADVEGYDAAAKAAILASLAFHSRVALTDVHRQGITEITSADVAAAAAGGNVIKLLAVVEKVTDSNGQAGLIARVHPALVPVNHPLASVHGAFNAVFVQAEAAGDLMFYGQGAGGVPTSSAVVGDVVAVARNHLAGVTGPGETAHAALPALPIGEATTRYQLRLRVADRPGVLSAVASVFAAQKVSIGEVRQSAVEGDAADLVIVTHGAKESALAATVAQLTSLETVDALTGVMRVEGE